MIDTPVSISTDDTIQPPTQDATGAAWRISTDAMTVELGWSAAVGLHLVSLDSADGESWPGDPHTPLLAIAWQDADATTASVERSVLDVKETSDVDGRTISVRMAESGHTVTAHLRVRETLPVAEAWLDITAGSAVTLTAPSRSGSPSGPTRRRPSR